MLVQIVFWGTLLILKRFTLCLDPTPDLPDDEKPRIVGGTAAEPGEFPYFVYINTRVNETSLFVCGGSIIHERYILTAAHCVSKLTPEDEEPLDIVVYPIGDRKMIDRNFAFHGVQIPNQLSFHPSNPGAAIRDVALIRLSKPIPLGGPIKKVQLPSHGYSSQTNVVLPGLGRDKSQDSQPPTFLKKKHMVLLDNQACRARLPFSQDTRCVAADKRLGFACKGDSGGPLVVKGATPDQDVVVGIASFITTACIEQGKEYYTDVYHYLNWIKSKMT